MYLRHRVLSSRLELLAASAAVACLVFADGAAQQLPNPAAAATNAFAFDLYRRLADDLDNEGDNLWFSPYSITSALAMAAEGARGSTREQMANTLHFGDPSKLVWIHEGVAELTRQLESGGGARVSQTNAAEPTRSYELAVANALWGEKRYPFDADYVRTLEQYYGVSGIFPVDFLNDHESARSRINAWTLEHTREKIAELLPPGAVDRDTRLVLTNAVYFKGSWAWPFAPRATSQQPFHLDATRQVSVPLMQTIATLGYMENDELQALWLPFGERAAPRDVSMIVVLPRYVDGLAEVERSLTAANLDAWSGARSTRRVRVFLPRFKMTTAFPLAQPLTSMGIRDAFNRDIADFSGISPVASVDRLYIAAVYHKAYLGVDEEGAEAAAATAIAMMGGRAAPLQEPVEFRADHPFLVLIRHDPSGTILFLGRLMDPSAR